MKLSAAVKEFLKSCREPVLNEPGEELFALSPETYSLEERAGRAYLQVWDDHRTLTRRLTGVADQRRGRLELHVERFGKRQGTVTLVDQADGGNHSVPVRSARQAFRERFRRMLSRQFPGCRISRLSSEPDLEHSLSPSYPRAVLADGHHAWAAIASPPGLQHGEGVLTFGLIWLDYLRRARAPGARVGGLAVFVGEGQEKDTCLRVRHLNSKIASYSVFSYSDAGERLLDLEDFGNVETKLEAQRDEDECRFSAGPEHALEMKIRADPEALDARLKPHPIYSQAPTLAAGQRGIIDLLATDRSGRLTIVELKASEDLHLPLQALDYWIRVKWHIDRGEFTAKGYFPGMELTRESPRMILAAPALQFHPANETVLRFLDPSIEVARIGLAPSMKVMFRM